MMNVHFNCPGCEQAVRSEFEGRDTAVTCPRCGAVVTIPVGAVTGRRLDRCLVCPSDDLFVRKDFPQRLGVAIVAVGFVASSVAWYYHAIEWTYGILFASAAVDVLLYLLCGDALACYRCGALYRDTDLPETQATFDLEVHERYRQQAARETATASSKISSPPPGAG